MSETPALTQDEKIRLAMWLYPSTLEGSWRDWVIFHEPDLAQELWPGVFDDGFGPVFDDDNERPRG